MQVSDAAEDLVEQVGHPLMVQVHVNDLAQARIHQLHHQVPTDKTAQWMNERRKVRKSSSAEKMQDTDRIPDTVLTVK